MATFLNLSFPLLSLMIFLALTPLRTFSSVPSSSVASTQLEFWSKNVVNTMPKTVASKLSPLMKQDSDSFASLLVSKKESSEQSLVLSSNTKFCSMANLACSSSASVNLQTNTNQYGGSGSYGLNSFFRLSVLQNGNRIQLPNLKVQIPPRSFLPYQIASKLSTTSSNENDLRRLFPGSFTSSTTKEAIKSSIFLCSSRRLKSEIKKSCPNSLEGMIEFSKKALGANKLIAITTKGTKGSEKQVEIVNIKQFHASKVVSCHEVFFPFATYLCHLLTTTRLYAVDFVEPTTTKAPVNKIMAICHMDTSKWPAQDEVLKILKLSPGHGEACHWLNQIDLVWIPNGSDNIFST